MNPLPYRPKGKLTYKSNGQVCHAGKTWATTRFTRKGKPDVVKLQRHTHEGYEELWLEEENNA